MRQLKLGLVEGTRLTINGKSSEFICEKWRDLLFGLNGGDKAIIRNAKRPAPKGHMLILEGDLQLTTLPDGKYLGDFLIEDEDGLEEHGGLMSDEIVAALAAGYTDGMRICVYIPKPREGVRP